MSDVVFIGKAKQRLNDIIKIFELLQENGLVCDFHIVGASEAEQRYKDKINYYPYTLPYYKVLQHVISSKCILEILQDGGSSHTVRVSEAIFYGKKLLSNCYELRTKPYYNQNYISLFSNSQDIDISFLKRDVGFINYNYKENLLPLRFIEHVDKHLNKD